MRKLIAITVVLMAYAVLAGPTIEPVVEQTVVKIDDQTCEITTTTTTETVVLKDRAELQTELDHIPDEIAKFQEQIDKKLERKAELIEILEVFK